MEVKVVAIFKSEIQLLILQFLRDDIPHSRKKIKSFCADRLNCSKKEISSLADEVINQLLAEHSADKESSGKIRIVKNFPSDDDFRRSILDFLKNRKSRHINVIRKFCADQFRIPPDFIDDCINEIFMPLVNEGKIERFNDEFYRIAEKSEITLPNQSTLTNWIQLILSDDKEHSLKDIQTLCLKNFSRHQNIYDENDRIQLYSKIFEVIQNLIAVNEIETPRHSIFKRAAESNEKVMDSESNSNDDLSENPAEFEFPNQSKIAKLTRKSLNYGKDHHMKKRGEIMKSGQSTYRTVSEAELPNQSQLIAAVREILSDGEEHSLSNIKQYITLKLNLSRAVIETKYGDSPHSIFATRVSAALTELRRKNELEDNVRRGFHKLKSPIQKTVIDQKIVIEAQKNPVEDQTLDRFDQAFIDSIREGNFEISDIKNACMKKLSISRAKKSREEFLKRMDKSRRKLQNLGLIEKVPNTRGRYRLNETLKTQPILIPSEPISKSIKSTNEDQSIQTVIEKFLSDGKILSFEELKNLAASESLDKTQLLDEVKKLYDEGILESPQHGFYKLSKQN